MLIFDKFLSRVKNLNFRELGRVWIGISALRIPTKKNYSPQSYTQA